ncbi:alpha/beta fold hydrolase [Motilimonas cestriensis]|uniref:alpha/beta fold hydrolase n=1 Tax=Motilimonas cestriensis TaxID=2742685 RepID=UPI003DA4ABFA
MEFVLVPGAWAGGWLWDEVAKDLSEKGHTIHQLTLSGLNEKSETDRVGLSTHVEDVESYIATHGLKSVVLVGHSYSGIVVGQVATRRNVSIHHSIFIEAFLPVSGQSLLEVSGLPVEEEKRSIANNQGMWLAPSREELESQPILNEAQISLLVSKQKPHPGNTVTEPAMLESSLDEIPATFMAHEGWLSNSRETELIDKLRTSNKWQFYEIDGGHWPMLSIPEQLSDKMHLCVALR